MDQFFFAQKAFIVKDNQLLLVRKSLDDPNQPGKWEVPGGRMDFGEEVDEHLKREVLEEVGLQVRPGMPFHIWQWRLSRTSKDGTPLQIQIVAVARLCDPETTLVSDVNRVEEDFLGETQWVPFADLKSFDLIPNMIPVVDAFLSRVQSSGER
jgi:8-oxo-dGTP pyrophosphatase MutT (NUDIX family)